MDEVMNEVKENKAKENKETKEKKFQKGTTSETTIDLYGVEDYCTVYSTHIKYKNWIKEMKEKHPEEVEIIFEDDGGIQAKMPKGCLKLSWPRQNKGISEEEKEVRRERLKGARENLKKAREKKAKK